MVDVRPRIKLFWRYPSCGGYKIGGDERGVDVKEVETFQEPSYSLGARHLYPGVSTDKEQSDKLTKKRNVSVFDQSK